MGQKWVIIGDELRMNNVNSYDELIGENKDIIKCFGTFEIDHMHKIIEFFIMETLKEDVCALSLKTIKKQGFYSPMIKDYRWKIGDEIYK